MTRLIFQSELCVYYHNGNPYGFFNVTIYSGKINNYMEILCRNDIFSLKIKPISHMILIYVSLKELLFQCRCQYLYFYLESATDIFRIRDLYF